MSSLRESGSAGDLAQRLRTVASFAVGMVMGMGLLTAITWSVGSPTLFDRAKSTTGTSAGFQAGNPPAYLVGFPSEKSLPKHESGNTEPPGTASMLEMVTPSVVRVLTSSIAGSGVVIERAGTVLTSAHIVQGNEVVFVLVEGKEPLIGTVTRVDKARDLALVKLPPGIYHSAYLGTEDDVFLGTPVYAIGYPLNMAGPPTITEGIVSRYYDEPDLGRQVIQTDAAINIGNSGGPILDEMGRIIGITTSILGDYPSRRTVGISFAVSIATIKEHFLEVIPNSVSDSATNRLGRVYPPATIPY